MYQPVIAMILSILLLSGCSDDRSSEVQRNIEATEQLFNEVWSEGNVDLLDDLIADGYVKHWATFAPTIGRDALKQAVLNWRESVPDHKEELLAVEASGDLVFVRWRETGTFQNDLGDIPATGNSFEAAAMGWIRFANGKIVEEWTIVDNLGTQTQLGIEFGKEGFSPGWD